MLKLCPACQKEFNTDRQSRIFCSRKCRFSPGFVTPWNKGRVGLKANRPRNGQEKTCKVCGAVFYQPFSRTENSYYCSRTCYLKNRWGDSHKEIRNCIICSTPFQIMKSAKRNTCSLVCSSEHRRRVHLGEQSHFWRGGQTSPYNKDWGLYRKKALERDNWRCAICGNTSALIVHHIIPYRYSHSHALANLVTLCRTCHGRKELEVNNHSKNGLVLGRAKVKTD